MNCEINADVFPGRITSDAKTHSAEWAAKLGHELQDEPSGAILAFLRRCFFVKGLSVAALLIAGCGTLQQESPTVLRGRLVLEVEPNPIVAVEAGEDLYDFRFDIVMREEGGVGVRIEDFTIDAIAFKTVPVRSVTFPASYIVERGYPASIDAGKYLRFSFMRRWQLPGRLLISGASARVTARTIDENGRRDETVVRVAVKLSGPERTLDGSEGTRH